jgi:hypothetical protein
MNSKGSMKKIALYLRYPRIAKARIAKPCNGKSVNSSFLGFPREAFHHFNSAGAFRNFSNISLMSFGVSTLFFAAFNVAAVC